MEWATLPLKRYAEFTGRSRRKEYWMFVLLSIGIYIIASVLDGIAGLNGMIVGTYGPITALVALGLLVPTLAVSIRRLHDSDRSGWWLLLGLVPLVGEIIVLVLMVLEGTRGANRFGADPKAGEVLQGGLAARGSSDGFDPDSRMGANRVN
jgi:uncharacterized membrane protein YhaH (DUF805 family)